MEYFICLVVQFFFDLIRYLGFRDDREVAQKAGVIHPISPYHVVRYHHRLFEIHSDAAGSDAEPHLFGDEPGQGYLYVREKPLLDRFSKELLDKEELDYDEIEEIFKEYGKQSKVNLKAA